ncbi:MAG: hypothetical protein ACI7YS_12775 [Flavobacterium sp.]
MITIFTGEYSEAITFKNVLDSFHIESHIINESMFDKRPDEVNKGVINSVILQVKETDYAKAKELLEDYNDGNVDSE